MATVEPATAGPPGPTCWLSFRQVDVFAPIPHRGNPVAVVHDADGLDDASMAAFARWTNLSETTFLLAPSNAAADYRLRIFTPGGELPFAGHPTLGSSHAWLEAGGEPARDGLIVQECGLGLITIRRDGSGLSFAAPPLRRSGPLDPVLLARIRAALGLTAGEVRDHQWVDNGPGWCAVLLHDAQRVLALRPDFAMLGDIALGVVGPHPAAHHCDFEVRAFVPSLGVPEDPVTGSLNAGIAQWLIDAGVAPKRYLASQGAALGREGRITVERTARETWIGGATVTCIRGEVRFPD